LVTDIEIGKIPRSLRITQARLSRAAQLATVGTRRSVAQRSQSPLSAVVANAHACVRWLSAQPPNMDKAQEAAEGLYATARVAARLVRRVRSLFQRAALEKVALDLNDVIDEVLRLLRARQEKTHYVETNLERDLPLVPGDRVQLPATGCQPTLNGLEAMDSVLGSPQNSFHPLETAVPGDRIGRDRDYGVA